MLETRKLPAETALVPQLDMAAALPAWHGMVAGSSSREERRLLLPRVGINLLPMWALLLALTTDAAYHVAGSMGGAARSTRYCHAIGGYPKRLLDITIASAALILLSPIMLLVAAAIKLTLGGPVIFAHSRVGLNGSSFRCFKFRSMVVNAEEVLRIYLESNPAAAQEWRETRKLRNDPRVTPLGRLLRKSSLDELPQLFNVLRGDMSCVGPRPIVTAELERYSTSARHYLRTRPGVTGLWQVSGRSQLSYRDRVVLDSAYVRKWSLWLDLAVMLRTIPAVLAFHETA